MANHFIPFGLNINGDIVSVADVPRGAECGCTCPGCGAALVAKQGDKKTWHFAHASGTACLSGYESALHLAAKSVLEKWKTIKLPDCHLLLSCDPDDPIYCESLNLTSYPCEYVDHNPAHRYFHLEYPNSGTASIHTGTVSFDKVILEKDEGEIRPDIIGYFKGTPLYVEIAVTHFVDKNKLFKIRTRGISAIEINLSASHKTAWTWEELCKQVVHQANNKTWLHN